MTVTTAKALIRAQHSLRAVADQMIASGDLMPIYAQSEAGPTTLLAEIWAPGILRYTDAGRERQQVDLAEGRWPQRGRVICSVCLLDMGPVAGDTGGLNSHSLCTIHETEAIAQLDRMIAQ